MDINEKIFDRIVDHMTDVRLYEEGVQVQNSRIVRRHRKNLSDLLRGNIRADVAKEVSRFGTELLAHQKSSITEFSTSQLDFHSDNLYKEVKDFYQVKRPRTKELLAEVTGPTMKGSKSLTDNIKNISSGELIRIQSKVKAGLARGASPNEIIQDVLKTTKITEHQAKTLTRTSITSTQTAALRKVAEDNKDLIKGFMFTAILDSRTSPICSFHNGKIYDIDDKRFIPPLHWNCRSSLIPVLKSKKEMVPEKVYYRGTNNPDEIELVKAGTIRKSKNQLTGAYEEGLSVSDVEAPLKKYFKYTYRVTGKEVGLGSDGEPLLDVNSLKIVSNKFKISNLKKVDPAMLNGVAPKRETFGEWLKRQPFNIQSKMLGSEDAANLFRQGKLKADQFITQKGKALSIQALRARAAQATSVFKPRQAVKQQELKVSAARPSSLIRNPKNKEELQQLFLSDADDYTKTMSLTDYKGTSLVGKTTSRRRVGNVFDERNFSADPLTGEIKNNLIYDPDFNLFQERLDFMRNSKLLNADEKSFIESVAVNLNDKVSVNQQTVIVENLRVVFERYAKDKTPWEDFAAVVRAENRFAVQNVSRLLDTRSRQRSEMFVSYLTSKDKPQVQIMGKYYNLDDLQTDQLKDQRYIDAWRRTEGTKLAKKIFFTGRAPLRVYFKKFTDKYPTKEKLIKKLRSNNKAFDIAYKAYKKASKGKEPTDAWITRIYAKNRETIRRILDAEFLVASKKPTTNLFDDAALDSITKVAKLIASGQATDYDSLAINIGKQFADDFKNLIPFTKHTLKDYHREGSTILEFMKDQGLIKINFRGKTRRGVVDVETGRPSGGWGDTISREVTVIDKGLLKLQEAERRVTISRRLGVTSERDRLYVKAGKKTYVDARGNDTGLPIVSRDKFPDYDEKQIDRDMANMLNHVMSVEYGVDNDFASFMDDVVRFRDPRGNSKYYDSINEFRHEILARGEQGYGLMATVKYHLQRGKNFRTTAFIDSRGRVYHRGYLTPTGGELVRPFLNSGKAINMSEGALDELQIQIGALLGTGTEALTQAGRRGVFNSNREKLLELGEIMLAKTQRDRRIREFLEHPLVRGLEGAEVPKLGRMAMEYARIQRHLNQGKPLSSYKTKLMIENDASSSGAQIIGLSTGDRAISEASNVLATTKKNRLYDLIAMDTVNDPEFLKIPALRNANITWEDLAKAAKAQNMVGFYGAGAATKTANVANKFSKALDDMGFITVTKDELGSVTRIIDGKIKIALREGADTVAEELTALKSELIEMINKNQPVGRQLLKEAQDLHPDVGDFVSKLTNSRKGIIGPKDFTEISRIMSKNMSQRAPITDNFINFWKEAAVQYVQESKNVDIPWVTFDGKIMRQRYRPKIQERIEFEDPVTGRKIMNIYESSADDGKLIGKSSIIDARIGLGVNGNHSNDAVIVRKFHLWGRKNNVETATIHDAFFTNIGEARRAKDALRTIYADALEGDTVRKTLQQMRKEGLSRQTYNRLLSRAKELGLIDPKDKITRKDILAPFREGEDWYGIGP
ncbi:minor capsid protein [bacterium]|nr:minor capsid protein [bacterium]